MEEKARKLVVVLEGIALLTALILILVDYKLKNDLVALYQKMEATLENGKKLFGESYFADFDSSGLRTGSVVDHGSTMEATASASSTNTNGKNEASARPTPKRSRRAGGSEVPRPDNTVGS